MGMYDNIEIDFGCPLCGRKIDGFQTKSGRCSMHTYCLGDLVTEDDGDSGYNDGGKPTEIHCYSHCIHRMRLDERQDFGEDLTLISNLKAVFVNIKIPIIDDRISPDRNTWKVNAEVREGENMMGGSLVMGKVTQDQIDAFNQKIEELEKSHDSN
jgi:hypothetical protein